MGKMQNYNKPNQFTRMCRSQRINEITEVTASSEQECNLIQLFILCEDFEIMSIELDKNRTNSIDRYIQRRLENKETAYHQIADSKIDMRKGSKWESMKSIKALVRIDNQIINITADTGSPISFLNWSIANQISESKSKVCPSGTFKPADAISGLQ